MEEVKSYFERLRFDKNHHLGLGDIRLTIAQQDEIVALIEQKLNKQGVICWPVKLMNLTMKHTKILN